MKTLAHPLILFIPLAAARLKQPPRRITKTTRNMVQESPKLFTSALLVATLALFVQDKLSSSQPTTVSAADFSTGIFFSFVATSGNAAVSLLRKQLSKTSAIAPAQQVGVATLLQGFAALVYCQTNGIDLGSKLSATAFLIPAVASSMLNAVTKTLETKAYAVTDVSLCAPFLAFDPVMQFVLPALLAPLTCSLLGIGCDDAKAVFPAYHPLAVASVAAGAFLLAKGKSKEFSLPLGSRLILVNCCIYALTSRLDKAAIKQAGKIVYYTYGRLLMASSCFAGGKRLDKKAIAEFKKPAAILLILLICLSEAVYMLALYQAFAKISPVYVTAIKRGGGLLLSSLAGVVFFNEPLQGRLFPILSIVCAVVALCS